MCLLCKKLECSLLSPLYFRGDVRPKTLRGSDKVVWGREPKHRVVGASISMCVRALGAASNFCTFFGKDLPQDSPVTWTSFFVSLLLVWIHESVGTQGISSAAMERGCFCTPSHFRTYSEYTTRYGSLLILEDMQKVRVFIFGTLLFSRWRQSQNVTKISQHPCTS